MNNETNVQSGRLPTWYGSGVLDQFSLFGGGSKCVFHDVVIDGILGELSFDID